MYTQTQVITDIDDQFGDSSLAGSMSYKDWKECNEALEQGMLVTVTFHKEPFDGDGHLITILDSYLIEA